MSVFARISKSALATTALVAITSAAAAAAPAHEDLSFAVALRGTGSATIHADVYNNPRGLGALTMLAVHGFTERGSMFEPLSSAIFSDRILGLVVKRVVAVDMPAHGGSSVPSLPSPLLFQDLTIEDDVSVVVQSIDALKALGKSAQIVIGHSMGGLEIQASQEALLSQGSSLARHGVLGAILVDAVPAAGTSWTQPPPNPAQQQFVVTDPVLGTILALPAAAGPFTGGFTKLDGTIVANAPSPATFVANAWVGPEPITTVLELVGTTPPLERPFVRQQAFALRNGTALSVVAGSQDVLTPIVDQPVLYTYLTGLAATGSSLYRPVVEDDAVHSMFVSNPVGLLGALENGVIH